MNIVFIALCVSVAGAASIPTLMTAGNQPCFVNDGESHVTTEILDNYLGSINARLDDLKSHTESRLQTMRDDYCIDVSDEEIETASFMHFPIMNATADREQFVNNSYNNSTSFLETMREHYDLLNELANYFQQLRHTAIDTSSLTSLISTQKDVYDLMCSIKIALRSKGQDPVIVVPSGNISNIFIQYREGTITRCIQQTSEYVTILDSKKTFDISLRFIHLVYRPRFDVSVFVRH